jgi:hypothetical protein
MPNVIADSSNVRPRAFIPDPLVVLLGIGLTVVLGLVLPGLGIVVGTAIAFIAYRHERAQRNAFIVLGIVITIIAFAGAAITNTSTAPKSHSDRPVLVHPPSP